MEAKIYEFFKTTKAVSNYKVQKNEKLKNFNFGNKFRWVWYNYKKNVVRKTKTRRIGNLGFSQTSKESIYDLLFPKSGFSEPHPLIHLQKPHFCPIL